MLWAAATLRAAVASGGSGGDAGFLQALLAFMSAPPVAQTGATTILLLGIVSILRGWLVPRAVMVDRVKDKDATISRQDKEIAAWREAHRVSEAGRAELKDQNSRLIQGQDNMNRFVDEFHRYFGSHSPEPQVLRQIEGGDDA